MRPHTQATAVCAAVLGVAVVIRVINTHLTGVIASEAREAAAELVADADARLVARKAAPRFVRVVNADVAAGALV